MRRIITLLTVSVLPLLATAGFLAQSVPGESINTTESLHAAKNGLTPLHLSLTSDVVTVQNADPRRSVFEKDDITQNHQDLAWKMLQQMPLQCQKSLKQFFVRYDKPKNRGLSGKSTMILTGNVSDSEFQALFAHEFGHITDLGCLQGTSRAPASSFTDGGEIIAQDDPSVGFYSISWTDSATKKLKSTPIDFVSGYAQTDPFEDFAETFAAYVLQNAALRTMALTNTAIAAKVAFLDTIVFKNDQKVTSFTSSYTFPTQKRPWDITKLPYSWVAQVAVVQ